MELHLGPLLGSCDAPYSVTVNTSQLQYRKHVRKYEKKQFTRYFSAPPSPPLSHSVACQAGLNSINQKTFT